jgi:hypothetical protein
VQGPNGGVSGELPLTLAPLPPPAPQSPPLAVLGAHATVACTVGRFSPVPSSVTYRWLRGGVELDGATRPSYRPTALDVGRPLACEVTATGAGGRTVVRSADIRLPLGVTTGLGGAALPAGALLGPGRARSSALRVALRLQAPVAGLAVRLQLAHGRGAWTTVLTLRTSRRNAVLRPRLRAGRQTLRVVYGPAGRTRTTPPVSVTVLP